MVSRLFKTETGASGNSLEVLDGARRMKDVNRI